MRKLVIVLPFLEENLRARIRAAAEVHGFNALIFQSEDDALLSLENAEIIVGQSPALAGKSTCLRWLCTPSAGIDQFAQEKAFTSGRVILSNSSGAYGVTIAEHVIMMILEMLRRQKEYEEIIRNRGWIRTLPVRSIHGSCIALLGTGDIGQETAVRLRAFYPRQIIGINRAGSNPRNLFDAVFSLQHLNRVLKESDIVVISLPGTKETYHLIDEKRLALLPDGALIVNVGRGSVISQKSLETELRSGRISAALDVFEQEPIPREDPLWDCPHLLITPHVAGNMTLPYTRERIVDLFLEDFDLYCSGKPLKHQVNLSRGY